MESDWLPPYKAYSIKDKKELKVRKPGHNFVINARRWFDKIWGNTYHSCDVFDNGKHIGRVDFIYGYGSQYEQTAYEIISRAYSKEFPTANDVHNFRRADYWRKNRKRFLVFCTDVSRKKDL